MNKKLVISTLVLLAISYQSCLAATQIPVTATAQVAPEGQFAPEIEARDQTLREGETLEFDVLGTDANSADSVHLEVTEGPPWLTIISNTDGNPATMRLEAAPPMGAIGRYKVVLRATDNSPYDLSSTKEIFIIVNPANQAPVITAQNQAVQAGQTLTFQVNCSDPDTGDTVTLTYTGKPSWLGASLPSPQSGNPIAITFTGTPQASDEGVYTMTFNAVDDGTPQASASKEITIIVTTSNDPPVLARIGNKEIAVRVALEFTITATDSNGDALTYSATGTPFGMGAVFNPSTRTFTWTPTNAQVGDYTVQFEVSDGMLTDSENITIFVTSSDAPIFDPLDVHRFDRTFIKRERVGRQLKFAVTARDPNDDPITYGASNLPSGATFDVTLHTFTWTPQPGQEGEYMVTFTASDGTYTTSIEVLVIAEPGNGPQLKPVGERNARVGQPLTFTLIATDPDTLLDQLTYSVSNAPPGSTLTGPNFAWTPTAAQVGTWRDIIFTVSDGVSSDSSNCWIFVYSNHAPILEHIGEKHVVEGRTLTFVVSATDPDGDVITYLQPENAPKGALFNPLTHVFTWTPAIGERGVYRDIIFSVMDQTSTVRENVWIFVDANDGPVVDPLFEQHVKAGQTLTFGVSAYDPNGDELTYTALNLPQGAQFENRTFTWTPTLSQVGVYKDILFEITDGVNIVNARQWIFVEEPGAPVMERVGELYVTAGQTLTVVITASDPDGDPLTYSATNLPQGAVFNPATRTFTWTPTLAQVGTYPDVLFYVTDGIFTDTEDSWIFVKSPNSPVLSVPGVPGGQRVRAGNLLEFSISASDPDTPESQLTYSASNLPPGAQFSNKQFSWTPTPEQIGTYPDINFIVSDGAHTDSKLAWIFVKSPGAPLFVEDIRSRDGKVDQPLVFTLQPADDPDNAPDELTYYGINLPSGATFLDRVFRWTPQTGQEGTYRDVRFEVKDPDNNIDSDIVWLYVGNSPPELDFIGTKYGTVGQLLTFTISATDADGDTLTYSARSLPTGATFNPGTRRFSWTPSQAGTFAGVHFEVSDGQATDSEDITIVVSQ